MALRTRDGKPIHVEFRKVDKTGVFFAEERANYGESVALLLRHGLLPLTLQEILVKVDQNPKLKELLKGQRVYLGEIGFELPEHHTFNEKGELTQGKGDTEKTVYVWTGTGPLSLYVRTDDDARRVNGRYILYACDACYIANAATRVVVGVQAGHGVAMPEIEVSPIKEGVRLVGVTTERLTELQRNASQELSEVEKTVDSARLLNMRMLVEALRTKE